MKRNRNIRKGPAPGSGPLHARAHVQSTAHFSPQHDDQPVAPISFPHAIPQNPNRLRKPARTAAVPLPFVGEVLQAFYDHELNFSVFSDWDGGYRYLADRLPLRNEDYDESLLSFASTIGETVGDLAVIFAAQDSNFRKWWKAFLKDKRLVLSQPSW